MPRDYLLWIATAFYAGHILEEYVYDWKTWASKTIHIEVKWEFFYLVNAAVIVLGISCASVSWKLPEFSLIYPALMAINAVFFHILPSLVRRKYAPGLITAVVLFLPLAAVIYVTAAQDGVLTTRALIISTLGAALTMAYPILLLMTKDRPFFQS